MNSTRPRDAVLAALNPVPADAVPRTLDERARADLQLILAARPASGPAARRWNPAYPLAAVLTVTALAVFLAAQVWPGEHAYAATPPLLAYQPAPGDAAVTLRKIAAGVAVHPDDVGAGRYARMQSIAWSLSTRVDGRQVTSAVVPQQFTRWVAADGSGRLLDRATMPDGQQVHEDRTIGAGQIGLQWPLRSLSSQDTTLADQLNAGHPVDSGPAERLVAVSDAYLDSPLTPPVRAAVLRYLADTPGLTLAGTTTDRAGRHGVAVSLESDYSGLPTRYILVIDPGTGLLLDSEQTLTTDAGKLNVPVPSVIEYTMLLSAQYTDTLT